jgi:thymidylate kinase
MSHANKAPDEIGRLFVFEGPDDVGKSTLASMLAQHLSDVGRQTQLLSFPGRETGTLSELIYRFYHNSSEFGVSDVSAIALQVMLTAAHIEVIESRLKPLIRAGIDIVLDRYWWSTWVYSTADGVPPYRRNMMLKLEMQSWENIQPEIVFFVVREAPLLPQPAGNRWSITSQLYKELVKQEERNVQIQLVTNAGSIQETFRTVISSLAGSS